MASPDRPSIIHHFHHAGHTLTWEEHTPGSHTLLFLHGYSANRVIWAREIARLGHLGRCVTLDLPGHAPATTPQGYRHLSVEELLDLELRAIAAIVGDGTATLIGHSTGGLIALVAAARMPAQIRRVIAFSPVVWGPLSGALGLYQCLLTLPGGYASYALLYGLTQRSRRFIQFGIGLLYSGNLRAYLRNPVADAAVRHWHPIYRQTRIRNLATLLLAIRACDLRAEAATVRCPMLVIAGVNDPVVPVAQSRWLAEHLANVELHALPGVGHLT